MCSKFCLLYAFKRFSKRLPMYYAQNYVHHHCNHATVHIQFYHCISMVRLQPVVLYFMLCCSALNFIFHIILNSMLMRKLAPQVDMITISQIKIVIWKVMNRMSTNWLIMTFNRLQWSFGCNFHLWAKSHLLCWHCAWCFQQPIILKIICWDNIIGLSLRHNENHLPTRVASE